MKRRHLNFSVCDDILSCTIDACTATCKTGLIIVSGGNEIRSGPHAGQSHLAKAMAAKGFAIMRFDRRGIGDSSGTNGGFASAKDDIIGAAQLFRNEFPHMTKIIALGNCDAASALILFHTDIQVDGLILTNPWTIDEISRQEDRAQSDLPSAKAIRMRYWQRLKDPQSLLRLLTGKVDFGKLIRGLNRARATDIGVSLLASKLSEHLSSMAMPAHIIIADQDRTASKFNEVWQSQAFLKARQNPQITIDHIASASHSFADSSSVKIFEDIVLHRLEGMSD